MNPTMYIINASVTRCQRNIKGSKCQDLYGQAIGQLKVFLLLKTELPFSLLPLADDIACVCCALGNLLPPLSQNFMLTHISIYGYMDKTIWERALYVG